MGSTINWDKLGCEIIPTRTIFTATKKINSEWENEKFLPYGKIELSPGAQVLNYGQGIFEGLKAQRTKNNDIVLFRPEANALRFQNSATYMNMPVYPIKKFVATIKEIVKKNIDYIPPIH